jgi:chorismate dehydratase
MRLVMHPSSSSPSSPPSASTPPSLVRLAAVEYLNTRPLIEGLEKQRGVTLIPCIPAAIIEMITSDRADLGLASIVDCVNAPCEMRLVPVGMIGCDGPTLTVRIYSRVPFENVTELYGDSASHTSVILARVIFKRRYNTLPALIPFDARARVATDPWPQTVLLIGDKVVTDAPPLETYPHQLDLGEAWHALTGLPFVYAMWMARADLLDSPRGAHVLHAARLLDRQRRHNATRLDWIVDTARGQWPPELARRYIGSLLRYKVDVRARQAVTVFLEAAWELGLTTGRSAQWQEAANSEAIWAGRG